MAIPRPSVKSVAAVVLRYFLKTDDKNTYKYAYIPEQGSSINVKALDCAIAEEIDGDSHRNRIDGPVISPYLNYNMRSLGFWILRIPRNSYIFAAEIRRVPHHM